MKKYWNKIEEIDTLIYLFNEKGLTISEISKEMKRSVPTIKRKIYELKLQRDEVLKIQIKINSCTGKKNGMYGKTAWSKGMTKETNDSLVSAGKAISLTRKKLFAEGKLNVSGINNGMYGKSSWNYGLTKETNKTLEKLGLKTSATKKEKWKALSKEEKQKKFDQLKEARKCARKKQTIPETLIENWLLSHNIEFEKQKSISYFLMDFYVNKNIVIECMGDYWHANPKFYNNVLSETQIKNKERDNRKLKYLQENHIPYIFLWEYDLKNNFNEIETKLNKLIFQDNEY